MKSKAYPNVISNPNFSEIESNIIKKWASENTFIKSLRGEDEFVFYDGPPFANGLPHYGHLLTGFVKDTFPRYQTMLGKKVMRRFGWDCHGLPAEMGAEKDLGISGRLAIEEYGINKFNNHCKNSVLKYTSEWKSYVDRQARWVDFENDYKTMDTNFMESVIWAFKTLYEKGLLYESMRVLPYSWACQTPVSDFETRMDNSYREKASKAVTLGFSLTKDSVKKLAFKVGQQDVINEIKVLAWTTTPWTLPSNLALAVGSEITYAIYIGKEGVSYIGRAGSEDPLSAIKKLFEGQEDLPLSFEIKGHDLVGLEYEPLFNYFKGHKNAFKILAADFVTTEDGTGIVHIAPGFGEDDHALCNKNNIELVCPVDEGGKFTYPVSDFLGMQVFDANDEIIKHLKNINAWIETEQYLHNYPHCWRTDTPLIYKAVPSWYLNVTNIKDKMIANNQKINWIPSHIKNGLFGKWLEGARDWSISRNRFWGCPIPVWQSDDPQYPCIEVYGSIEELEKSFNVKVEDLHRPFIDTLVKPNPKDPTGKSMLRRVPDVLDCWFESGSMPFAQVHYPFENKDWFEKNFPADFIVEYVGQTRGWFYTLIVLATAIFDKPPFLNCICHGIILGDGGKKLSKRLKNYADPNDVFNEIGADAMRWYMLSSAVMRGQEVVIDKDAKSIKEVLRLVIKPLWNAYNFFTMYANADEIIAEFDITSSNLMDKYLISTCGATVLKIKESMDNFDTPSATKVVEEFLESLNNWYIRRCRERFWKSEKDQDKINAYNSLYSVLHILCRAIAPLMPIISEEIFLGITQRNESVHLQSFPEIDFQIDLEMLNQMTRVRDACNAVLSIRNQAGIRVRQPLASVTFIGVSDIFSDDMALLIMDETNAKNWNNLGKADIGKYANYRLQINFPVLGKRLPSKVKDIISANKANQWSLQGGKVSISGELLEVEEFSLKLEPKLEYSTMISPLSSNDGLVLLDLNITDELMLEGIARDVVRAIQQMRKNNDLNITDRINVSLYTDDEKVKNSIVLWDQYIKDQTLSDEIIFSNTNVGLEEVDLEGRILMINISK